MVRNQQSRSFPMRSFRPSKEEWRRVDSKPEGSGQAERVTNSHKAQNRQGCSDSYLQRSGRREPFFRDHEAECSQGGSVDSYLEGSRSREQVFHDHEIFDKRRSSVDSHVGAGRRGQSFLNRNGQSRWRGQDEPQAESQWSKKASFINKEVSQNLPCALSKGCFGTANLENDNSQMSCSDRVLPHAFDICDVPQRGLFKLNASLLEKNRERRKTEGTKVDVDIRQLRPGMILLTSYICHADQVKIVQKCRELGLGPGGFYQPGYKNGAKLHLHMMCLGKKWNPGIGYEEKLDDASASEIPDEFKVLVERALQTSHSWLNKNKPDGYAADSVPPMTPNICIVNFYTRTGKLGLHQDKDETDESLRKGLPVVSFSFGDAAVFIYSDDPDGDSAERIELRSGDVLIFGGMSRHIFHGVSSVLPNTTSRLLCKDTDLRPGRLNLTFRQY